LPVPVACKVKLADPEDNSNFAPLSGDKRKDFKKLIGRGGFSP
jgi:hypothetical protein